MSGTYFRCTPEEYKSVYPSQFSGNCTNCTPIRVFFNGKYCVAPNPADKDLVAHIQQQYSSGKYISYRDLCIPDCIYYNPKNWILGAVIHKIGD